MFFALLHERLVEHLRSQVKSGQLTERSLARLAGISQPHLHNVLKGVRELSPATADVVVMNLRLSALDLVRQEELAGTWRAAPRYREVPLAAGRLGPGHPFPDLHESVGRLTFSAAELEGIVSPVAVRLAADDQAPPIFSPDDVVLLDVLTPDRRAFQPGSYYVIDTGRCGLLRRSELADPAQPGAINGVVRAKAIWIGRYLRPPADSGQVV